MSKNELSEEEMRKIDDKRDEAYRRGVANYENVRYRFRTTGNVEPKTIDEVKAIKEIMQTYEKADKEGLIEAREKLIKKCDQDLRKILAQACEKAENAFWDAVNSVDPLDKDMDYIMDEAMYYEKKITRKFEDLSNTIEDIVEWTKDDILTSITRDAGDLDLEPEVVEEELGIYKKTKQKNEENVKAYFEEMQR